MLIATIIIGSIFLYILAATATHAWLLMRWMPFRQDPRFSHTRVDDKAIDRGIAAVFWPIYWFIIAPAIWLIAVMVFRFHRSLVRWLTVKPEEHEPGDGYRDAKVKS